jgi:iron-sulfur cluster assembly accessory protein
MINLTDAAAGFQYGMSLEEAPMEGDVELAINGINVIIDPRSAMYVEGAEVDFVNDGLMGGGFKIDNPNAASTCGCGTSFTPKDGEEAEAVPAGAGGCGSCANSGGY